MLGSLFSAYCRSLVTSSSGGIQTSHITDLDSQIKENFIVTAYWLQHGVQVLNIISISATYHRYFSSAGYGVSRVSASWVVIAVAFGFMVFKLSVSRYQSQGRRSSTGDISAVNPCGDDARHSS
jgi:hypothetical protein